MRAKVSSLGADPLDIVFVTKFLVSPISCDTAAAVFPDMDTTWRSADLASISAPLSPQSAL
jgi:hypothetical protein